MLSSAQALALEISPFVSMALTFGGDTLAETQVGDPKLKKTESIKAGQFMYFATGATFALPEPGDWEVQSSIGYWFDSVQTGGHELRFRRVPIDLLLARSFDKSWRVLGGLTYHLNPERRCTLDNCPQPSSAFKNAIGLVAEADWLFGGIVTRVIGVDEPRPTKLWVGVRMTLIEYKTTDVESSRYSGNNFGLTLGLNF
ncbi:MAG: hypothetical protein HY273_12495 [Gammaproteobacteria bacterium]|nr:hypothetical protein [Gammaproteobacteria bacterium]